MINRNRSWREVLLIAGVVMATFISTSTQAASKGHNDDTDKKIETITHDAGLLHNNFYEVKVKYPAYDPSKFKMSFWVKEKTATGYKMVKQHQGPGSFIFRANRNNYLVGITVTPVPEPHEWAMLLVGLGLIGYQLRRRRAAPRFSFA